MKCYYHTDLDGMCSAAIILKMFPDCDVIPINYGWDMHLENVEKDEIVYIVDFTPEPINELLELHKICGDNLFWIDHHQSAKKLEKEHNLFDINGVRVFNDPSVSPALHQSGCDLTWSFMVGGPRPQTVTYLGRYDVWDHTDKNTVPFQYGMGIQYTHPTSHVWKELLNEDDNSLRFVSSIIEHGKPIFLYEGGLNKRVVNSISYPITWNSHKAIVVNRSYLTSHFFNDVDDVELYDMFIWWWYDKKGHYEVRVSTPREDIDVGQMCEDRGGGGHRKIGGFKVDDINEFLYKEVIE